MSDETGWYERVLDYFEQCLLRNYKTNFAGVGIFNLSKIQTLYNSTFHHCASRWFLEVFDQWF